MCAGYVEGRGGRGTTPDPFVNGCVAKGLKELGRELGASGIFPCREMVVTAS